MPLRPATDGDRAWLIELVNRPEVVGSLAVGADATLIAALARTEAAAEDEGVLVVEDDQGGRAGVVCWQTHNRRSRIAGVHTLVIDPAARGRGHATFALREVVRHLLDERGFHRIEAGTYGFNQSARLAFQAAAFVREGIRRRAYDRHGAWQDGLIFGLVADDRRSPPGQRVNRSGGGSQCLDEVAKRVRSDRRGRLPTDRLGACWARAASC